MSKLELSDPLRTNGRFLLPRIIGIGTALLLNKILGHSATYPLIKQLYPNEVSSILYVVRIKLVNQFRVNILPFLPRVGLVRKAPPLNEV